VDIYSVDKKAREI